MMEMRHVEDVVGGGGLYINPLYNTLGYASDEIGIRLKYGIISNYKPKGVSEIEQKLYDYLNAERVMVGKSEKLKCEGFVASVQGFSAIVFPIDAEDEDYNLDRLIALSHEIGHYLDLKFNYDFDVLAFDSENNRDKKLKKELLAWNYAYDILNALGFNRWIDFIDTMKVSLMTYFEFEEKEMLFRHIEVIERLVRNAG